MSIHYKEVYLPLLTEFYKTIKDIDCSGIPFPWLPEYADEYDECVEQKRKIVFIGIDTKRNDAVSGNDLERFKELLKSDAERALFSWDYEFDNEISKWANGNNFIGYMYQLVATLNNVDDWKKIKNQNTEKHKCISRSFVYANSNIIEGYAVSSEKNNVKLDNYKKIKNASVIFDKLSNIIQAFEPNVIIINNWSIEKQYFDGIDIKWIRYSDYIEYCFFYSKYNDQNILLIHTCHPRYMSKIGGKKNIIKNICNLIKQEYLISSVDNNI
jgi:hypothetical protein